MIGERFQRIADHPAGFPVVSTAIAQAIHWLPSVAQAKDVLQLLTYLLAFIYGLHRYLRWLKSKRDEDQTESTGDRYGIFRTSSTADPGRR